MNTNEREKGKINTKEYKRIQFTNEYKRIQFTNEYKRIQKLLYSKHTK